MLLEYSGASRLTYSFLPLFNNEMITEKINRLFRVVTTGLGPCLRFVDPAPF